MVYEIVWTPKAIESFESNLEYLKENWTENEIRQFFILLEKKLSVLEKHPEIGRSKSKANRNIRQTVLHKRIIIIYRSKPRTKKVELLLFWNTYKHPSKLKL